MSLFSGTPVMDSQADHAGQAQLIESFDALGIEPRPPSTSIDKAYQEMETALCSLLDDICGLYPVLAQLVCEFAISSPGFQTHFTHAITYSDENRTARYQQPDRDVMATLMEHQLGGRYLYELTIHSKSDELWFGVTTNPKVLLHHSGFWCLGECYSYYGGRQSYIAQAKEGVHLDWWSLRDGPWGSLQLPGKCLEQKLAPYRSAC